MSGRLAVVTGATGCIGSAIARELSGRGYAVRALVRADDGRSEGIADEVHVGDLLRPQTLEGLCDGADLVIHTAALVSDWDPKELFWQMNRDGTRALLDDALRCGAGRFVYFSTVDVFGFGRHAAVDERSPRLCPRYHYPQSKLAGEQLTWAYARRGLDVSVIWPTWVFGPGDRHLVPELADGLRSGELLHFDRGAPNLELTYSENLAAATALVATDERAVGEGYIVGDGYGWTLGMFVEEIARLAGLPSPRGSIPFSVTYAAATVSELWARLRRSEGRPLMTRYAIRSVAAGVRFDCSKLRGLGYEPRVGVSEGLRRTLETVDWLDAPEPGRPAEVTG